MQHNSSVDPNFSKSSTEMGTTLPPVAKPSFIPTSPSKSKHTSALNLSKLPEPVTSLPLNPSPSLIAPPALGPAKIISARLSSPPVSTHFLDTVVPPSAKSKRIRKPSIKYGPDFETIFPRTKGKNSKKPKTSVSKNRSITKAVSSSSLPHPNPVNPCPHQASDDLDVDSACASDDDIRARNDALQREAQLTLEVANILGLQQIADEDCVLRKLMDLEKAELESGAMDPN